MKNKKDISILSKVLLVLLICAVSIKDYAQQIQIDKGIQLEGLWCFPVTTDTTQYLFLPDHAFLAVDEKQQPQFSFIRYVSNSIDTGNIVSGKTNTQAGGGGILHFLITYNTDESKIRKAEAALRQQFDNDNLKLQGPAIFKEGRFALVSSVLNPAGEKTARTLMAIGAAPVLQGSSIALSFEMDPEHANLLMQSFKTATPDVSLVFDLTFSGLTDAYNAKLTIDWSEVQKNEKIGGGFNFYFVSTDLEKVYAELTRTNAIKLETAGEDARMEGLVNSVYSKITELMFRPVEPAQLPAGDRAGLGAVLGGLFSNDGNGAFSSGKTFGFGAHVGYKLKDIKTSGYSILNFNSRTSGDRHHYITFNIGDFYKKYGLDDQYFRLINLDGSEFTQRNILVGVDGALLPEFNKLINSITVTLRKIHQNGSTTIKEVNINQSSITDNKTVLMSYGSISDSDRLAWLNYDFKVQYNFIGGKTYQTGWQQQDAAMINLFVPYERRVIRLEGDSAVLTSQKVRAATIRVEYPFFGEKKITEVTVKPGDDLSKTQFEIILPSGQYYYSYAIQWTFKDGTTQTTAGKNDTGILFIDTIPAK